MTIEELKRISTQVRRDVIRMVTHAQSGHPGGSMSSADILTALFFEVMQHDPKTWERNSKGQDTFILSAGHISPVYYSILARSGYFPVDELATFRQLGSRLQGHPSIERALQGVIQASGSLGQGLSAACGLALAKKIDKEEHFSYVLCGDGECQEGQIWEAAQFAPMHKLDRLVAMVDWNHQQIDGEVEFSGGEDNFVNIWKAFGWNTIVADGHDFNAIIDAFQQAKNNVGSNKPSIILFKTIMGYGVNFMSGTCKWHGKAPSEQQCKDALKQLDETLGDFKIS